MFEALKKISRPFIVFFNSKRVKALAWSTGAMLASGLMDLAIQELADWNPDNIITITAGLIFAQITKYINNKYGKQ